MRKLEKLTLKELRHSNEQINQLELGTIKGGTSWEEYQQLDSDGYWYGGYVDGMGYVGQTQYANADGPNTVLMNYGELIHSQQESTWSVVQSAAASAAMDWNPVTAYMHDIASTADDMLQIARQNQLNDALYAIWSSGSSDGRLFSVTYVNGNLSIYDTNGNLQYSN